ncbi:hypothetical protein KIPB_014431, partial [Kipferlia bialata]|eukprot:g14431.t1
MVKLPSFPASPKVKRGGKGGKSGKQSKAASPAIPGSVSAVPSMEGVPVQEGSSIKHPIILVPGLGGTVLKVRHKETGKELVVWPRLYTEDAACQRFLWGDTVADPEDETSPLF